MNTKSLLLCFFAVVLTASMAAAGTPHRSHFVPAQGGSVHGGTSASRGGNWSGRWGGGDWHRHHHNSSNNFVFVGGFGFPFLGYPYGYSYYPYGYGYGPGYYGYGSDYGYGSGYGYGANYYGNGYYRSSYYPGSGYGYGYGNGDYQSSVTRLQQRLARAGYYRGPIDGIMGPRTRYALRAYRHDHGTANYEAMR
jgi:Putative peptidoglycan binding domain